MSIWCSGDDGLFGYSDEYPDETPDLNVDVAWSYLTPLLRIAAWGRSRDVEFYVSPEQAEALAAHLLKSAEISRNAAGAL